MTAAVPLRVALLGACAVLLSSSRTVAQSVASIVARAERAGFKTGVVVRDLDSRRDLYQHRGDTFLLPASNQKLLTAAATLWGLGPEFEFRTVFRVRAGVLEIHAAGDPNWLGGTENAPAAIFGAVAARLRAAGIDALRGLRLDQGVFSGPVRPPGWPENQFDRTYCAPTGGLMLEAGCFTARIAPGAERAQVTVVQPPLDLQVGGTIQISRRSKKRFSYWVSQTRDRFTGHGTFSAKAKPVEVRGVAQNPAWLFETAVRSALGQAGIRFASDAPAGDAEVLTWKSGLRPAFREMLESSSNFHAEQLLRTLGAQMQREGSFEAGCRSVRAALATRLEIPDGLTIVDGSGLSRGNRVSPAFLVSVLQALAAHPHGDLVFDHLPQGGRTGTLKRRFRGKGQAAAGLATRAKTGYINGVRSLSGLVVDAQGHKRVFSVIMNQTRGTSTKGSSGFQDALVTAIYEGKL